MKLHTEQRTSARPTLTKLGQHRKRFDILTTRLAIAKRHIDCFSALWDAQGNFNKELFATRDFWFLTAEAHLNCGLLQLCGVYDYNAHAINLRRYLKEVQKSWSQEVAEASLTSQLQIDIAICDRRPFCENTDRQPYVTLVKTLREWRNEIVAHLNYDVALFIGDALRTRNAWTVSDIRQLIDEAVTIVDRYSFSRGKDIRYTECFDGRADYLLAEEVICKSVRSASWKSTPSNPS